ncbi:hypothetical protein GGH98_002646, partial [Coemansia sp. RSA 454]
MANNAKMMLEVEIFDGSGNFADWSEQVILTLRQKGVLDYVESDMHVGTAEEPDKKKFNPADSKADGLAVAIILRCMLKSHWKRFIWSTAFEVWTELQKLYGVPNMKDLMSNLLELFSFRIDPNDKEGRTSAVQYSNLMNKIDFSTFSSSAMANLMYLAMLNKHHDSVRLKFAKKKPNELEFDDIFHAVCMLSDANKKQCAYDEKIGASNFGGAAHAQRPTCKHCRCFGHLIENCWSRDDGGSGNGNCNGSGSNHNGGGSNHNGGGSNRNGGGGNRHHGGGKDCGVLSFKIGSAAFYAAHATVMSPLNNSDNIWLLDSGANASTCNDEHTFIDMTAENGTFTPWVAMALACADT